MKGYIVKLAACVSVCVCIYIFIEALFCPLYCNSVIHAWNPQKKKRYTLETHKYQKPKQMNLLWVETLHREAIIIY